jgi:hypothetical protein
MTKLAHGRAQLSTQPETQPNASAEVNQSEQAMSAGLQGSADETENGKAGMLASSSGRVPRRRQDPKPVC